jgi:hypothetical protein
LIGTLIRFSGKAIFYNQKEVAVFVSYGNYITLPPKKSFFFVSTRSGWPLKETTPAALSAVVEDVLSATVRLNMMATKIEPIKCRRSVG